MCVLCIVKTHGALNRLFTNMCQVTGAREVGVAGDELDEGD